jgi:hypothetical protein
MLTVVVNSGGLGGSGFDDGSDVGILGGHGVVDEMRDVVSD